MRILRGSPALSEFRVNKLVELCREQQLPVSGIYAEFMHFADLSADLDAQSLEKFFDTADQSMSSYEHVFKITRKMSKLPYV